jgi:Domain of unknown function (DUF4389)
MNESYPLTYSVEYPDRQLNRLSTFFRIFAAIPIFIVLATVNHYVFGGWDNSEANYAGAGGILFLGPLLMILFRKKYPRWWFDWNRELLRFSLRVHTYIVLMSDRYPSTDEEQWVRLEINYPNVETELARGMPLVKWFLAIPHYVVLFFLGIAAFVSVIIAWFAILFTGRYPRSLFDFVMGVQRWGLRVAAYAFLLVTDKYPPFSLQDETGPTATTGPTVTPAE